MRNENKQQDALFTMTIEIDEGRVGVIPIYEDSIPEKLAFEFCKKYNLDFQTLNYLTKQISFFIMEHKHQIIVEEDEENQTSGQRGDMHSRSESNININRAGGDVVQTDMNNSNSNNNIKYGNSSSSSNNNKQQYQYKYNQQQQQQRKCKPKKYETFNNIFSSGICEPQGSLFSYNEFYNRFKQTILNKKHSTTSTTTTIVNTVNTPPSNILLSSSPFNNSISPFKPPSTPTAQHQPKLFQSPSNNSHNNNVNLHNKSSDSFKPQYTTTLSNNNISRLTLAKNEELITNFLRNCNNLDDIYQPQPKSISVLSKQQQQQTFTTPNLNTSLTPNDIMYTYSNYNSNSNNNNNRKHIDKKQQNVKLNNIKQQLLLKNNNISTLQLKKVNYGVKKCKSKSKPKQSTSDNNRNTLNVGSSRNVSYDYKKYSYRKYNNSNCIKKNKRIVNSSSSAEIVFSKMYTVFTNANYYYKYSYYINKIHPSVYNVILPLINKVKQGIMKKDVFIKEGMKLYNEMIYYNKHLLLNLNIDIN